MTLKDKIQICQKTAAEILQPIEQLYERRWRSKRRAPTDQWQRGKRATSQFDCIACWTTTTRVASPSIGLSLPAYERPERVNNVSAFHAGLAPGPPASRLDNLPLRLSSRKSRSYTSRLGQEAHGPGGQDGTTAGEKRTEREGRTRSIEEEFSCVARRTIERICFRLIVGRPRNNEFRRDFWTYFLARSRLFRALKTFVEQTCDEIYIQWAM